MFSDFRKESEKKDDNLIKKINKPNLYRQTIYKTDVYNQRNS